MASALEEVVGAAAGVDVADGCAAELVPKVRLRLLT